MDLKFKKIMVMAMAMNSAHKRVMKVSPNSIIHLEMFTDVSIFYSNVFNIYCYYCFVIASILLFNTCKFRIIEIK